MTPSPPRKSILPYLLLLGIVVPATELFLLMLITSVIGFWSTIGIIIGTGAIGVLLWRWQGFGVMARIRASLLKGESPANTLVDGAMIFFAGGLLLTPGVLTDVVGFAILIPWTRSAIKLWVFKWIRSKFPFIDFTAMPGQTPFGNQGMPADYDDREADIVEGEIVDGENNDGEYIDGKKPHADDE